MKFKKLIGFAVRGGVALIGLGLSLPATAAVLVNYQFPVGNPFNPTTSDFNLTASAVNAIGSAATIGVLGIGLDPTGTLLLTPGGGASTPALAVSGNRYFQFSVTPNSNFDLDLTSLTFVATRGGAATPRGWILRSSLDNYAADIATETVPTARPTGTNFSIDLSGAGFQNLTSSVTFRIYGYTPSGGQSIDFDNLTLNGTVSPSVTPTVPEPSSTVALLSLAAIGGGAFLKRRIGK